MLGNSATDIYPLAFIALAWLGWLSGRGWLLGAALGLAVMSKIAPSLFALPLLALPHPLYTWRKIGAAVIALFGTISLFALPFILADAQGFVGNYILWALAMAGDGSGWTQYFPQLFQTTLRIMVIGFISLCWLRLYLRQYKLAGAGKRTFSIQSAALSVYILSLVLVMLSGSVLHSNYFTWVAGLVFIFVAASSVAKVGLSLKVQQQAEPQPIPAAT